MLFPLVPLRASLIRICIRIVGPFLIVSFVIIVIMVIIVSVIIFCSIFRDLVVVVASDGLDIARALRCLVPFMFLLLSRSLSLSHALSASHIQLALHSFCDKCGVDKSHLRTLVLPVVSSQLPVNSFSFPTEFWMHSEAIIMHVIKIGLSMPQSRAPGIVLRALCIGQCQTHRLLTYKMQFQKFPKELKTHNNYFIFTWFKFLWENFQSNQVKRKKLSLISIQVGLAEQLCLELFDCIGFLFN